MKLLVFTSSGCPHCPRAGQIASKVIPYYSDYGLLYKKIRTKSEEGKIFSERYRIMSVPTTLIVDDDGDELNRIVGVPSEAGLRKKIEKSLGLKSSFLSKLFGEK